MIGADTAGKTARIRQHFFHFVFSQIRTKWTTGLSATKAALFNASLFTNAIVNFDDVHTCKFCGMIKLILKSPLLDELL